MAELRGLGEVYEELERQGGRLLAIAVDPPAQARRVVEKNRLEFPVLCDTDRKVLLAYGLVHQGGGPDGSDIAVPAHVLIDRDGQVVRRFVSHRIQERLASDDVLRVLRMLPR